MNNDRSVQNGPVFVLGMMLGAALGFLASTPKSREWMNNKAEWARTDGKEAMNRAKGHAREGMEAVKSSAKNIKEDVGTLHKSRKTDINNMTNSDEL
jgi:hypothetical protein